MFLETKEAGEVQQAPAKVLKLSDYIRIGSKIRPQGRIFMYAHGKTCALGAGYEGLTGRIPLNEDDKHFNFIVSYFGIPRPLAMECAHKNDAGWTREDIADHLASLGY